MDCLFVKHAVVATALCKILCKRIATVLQKTEDDRIVEDRLKRCVVYYSQIISYAGTILLKKPKLIEFCFRYVTEIQTIFSYAVLIQFLSSAIVICLTGFQLLVVSCCFVI